MAELRGQFEVTSQVEYQELSSYVISQGNYHHDQVRTLRSLYVFRLFVAFEKNLNSFCRAARQSRKLNFTLKSSKRGIVKDAEQFLCDRMKLLDSKHSIWERLDGIRVLRNHLVHNRPLSDEEVKESKIANLVRMSSDLSFSDENIVEIGEVACDRFHATVEEFFELCFESIGWKAFRQNKRSKPIQH